MSTFASLGIDASPSRDLPPESEPCTNLGVVGFSGTQLRGAVLLGADSDALAAVYPAASVSGPVDDDILLDWLGELTNMIMGRIKLNLREVGVLIEASTPTSISGLDIHVGRAARNRSSGPHRFVFGPVSFTVRLDALPEGDLTFREDLEPVAAPSAGDVFFF